MVALNAVVYNELHRLPEFIAHASSWASELVIVDQTSTDGTWEWLTDNATEMDLTLVRDKHWGYCEPSRHLAWRATKSEYIGVLDADERFSIDFKIELSDIIGIGYTNVRLKRSFWLAGEHRFTGDTQHRFFHRDHVRFLPEIHTEPQISRDGFRLYEPTYVGIIHEKSWAEQIRDEENYEKILKKSRGDTNREAKLALNVHLKLLREHGITPEEADAMTIEERIERGIGAYERTESS